MIHKPRLALNHVLAAVIVFTILYVGYLYASEFLKVDSCLDRSGCWDYSDHVCRMHETNAQELCDKSMGK
ncbi:MAG: hypothetical protein EOP05_01365 [Proteobacteria bacterium]|nr:MAG: hypothetical protein EOP05_01365 [Pseudomonadota bacterium]